MTRTSTEADSTPATTSSIPSTTAGNGDLLRQILRLTHGRLGDASLFRDALRVIAVNCGAVFAHIKLPLRGGILDDYWHTGPMDPSFWRAPANQTLTQCLARGEPVAQRFRSKSGTMHLAIVGVPLCDGNGDAMGAITLVIDEAHEQTVQRVITEMRAVAALLGAATRTQAPAASEGPANGLEMRSAVLAGGAVSRTALAFSITNQLRSKLGCDQVALAVVRGRTPRLLSISGFPDVSERTPGAMAILGALSEGFDLGRPTAVSAAQTDGDVFPLHRRWSASVEGAHVATVPLRDGDRIHAMLSLRHAPGRRFSDEELKKISEAVAPYAAALRMAELATRGLGAHASDSVRGAIGGAFRRRGIVRTATIVASVAAAMWVVFGTTEHHVTATARLDAAKVLHMSVPFATAILGSDVAAGDVVRKNQVLFELDTTTLRLERARVDASIAAAMVQAETSRARGDQASVRLIEAKADIDRAMLNGLQLKIDSAVVRAPADGIILRGDLRQRVGATVAAGETLLEFVPKGALEVTVEIPERDVLRVVAGRHGQFRSHAAPDSALDIEIDRVRPSAEVRGNQNVFVAEARISLPEGPQSGEAIEEWMRCGVEGTARISVGDKPVWWSLFHRATDAVRMRLWL